MGLLDILAGIGGGLEGGGKAAAELERRKRERAEEVRQQAEFDQANADRTGLRQAMHGIYDDTKRDTADENATMVEAAGEGMDRLMPERSYGDIQLPFAGVMKKGADAVRTEGAKPSQFDPNVPYDKLVAIQNQRRDTDARIVDRRTTQNQRRDQFDLNTRKADEASAAAARKRGDVETGRAMLLRLAQQKDPRILYTEEEIKGLSPEAVDKLTEQFGKGTLGTGDFRDRQTIKVELTPPKSGGGSGADNNATLGDLNGVINNQSKQVQDLFARAPDVVTAKGLTGTASSIAGKLLPEERAKPDVQKWLSDLQQAESAGDVANRRAIELTAGGVRRGVNGDTPPLDRPASPRRPAAPASGPTPAQRKQYLDLIDQGKSPEEAIAIVRGG